MQSLSKRLLIILFLLVLASLAAHVLMDIQHGDSATQTKWDMCLLHAAILLTIINLTTVTPALGKLPHKTASSRSVPVPIPFHPPIF